MNYSSYQSPADPAAITLPSDGSATPYQLNPTRGVQTATATPADAPVVIDGVQLSAAQAKEYGFTNELEVPASSVSNEEPSEAQEAPSELPEDVAENALDEGTAGALEGLLSERGDVAMSVINSVINDGNISEENLSDISNASGLSMEQAEQAFAEVSEHFDAQLNGNSSLLSLASETDPQATKSAIIAGLHGDYREAERLIAATASTMDVISSSESLVDALNENGYETSFSNGRLYVKGNEYSIPQPWSRVYSAFDLSFI
jgi:hypothetical protein